MVAIMNEQELNIETLTGYADYFLKQNYNMSMSVPLKRNNRLKRAMGQFKHMRGHKVPTSVELSGELLDYGHPDIIISVLKHELIHYALYMQDRDYKDGQADFENELKKHHAHSTRTINFGRIEIYRCDGCQREMKMKLTKRQKANLHYCRTTCCSTTFEFIGEKIFDGSGKQYFKETN